MEQRGSDGVDWRDGEGEGAGDGAVHRSVGEGVERKRKWSGNDGLDEEERGDERLCWWVSSKGWGRWWMEEAKVVYGGA